MYKIKYDKKSKKILYHVASYSTALLSAGLLWQQWSLPLLSDSETHAEQMVMLINCLLLIVCVSMWLWYWDSCCYLNRLKKYGLPIPENKKDYCYSLSKLADSNESQYGVSKMELVEFRENRILACMSWIMMLIVAGHTISYYICFWHVRENIRILGFICIAITFVWGLLGRFFYKQRNPEKYRDDVNFRSAKKKRVQFVGGLAIIIILVGITLVSGSSVYIISWNIESRLQIPLEQPMEAM